MRAKERLDRCASARRAALAAPPEPAFVASAAGAMLLQVRGRLRVAAGERVAGIEDLRACGATWGALGIGPAMSETHLSHAYGKLDLAGPGARRRLTAALSG